MAQFELKSLEGNELIQTKNYTLFFIFLLSQDFHMPLVGYQIINANDFRWFPFNRS